MGSFKVGGGPLALDSLPIGILKKKGGLGGECGIHLIALAALLFLLLQRSALSFGVGGLQCMSLDACVFWSVFS